MSDGSSFVEEEEEEEEFETASSEVPVKPAVKTSVATVQKGESSELSSLSSTDDDQGPKPPTLKITTVSSDDDEDSSSLPAQKGKVQEDESSVSLSESRSVERTGTLDAPPPSLQKSSLGGERGHDDEDGEDEDELETEGETETSEQISTVESSEKITSIKSPKAGRGGQVAPAPAPTLVATTAVAVASEARSVVAAPSAPVANKCGPIKCPLEGPIEVDIEDLARICRCGQSAKFPYCDNSHVAYNAENGSSFGFWPVDPQVMGSTLYVCGCGKSARREAGIPLCDYACRPQEDVLVKVTVASKPPVFVDVAGSLPQKQAAPAPAPSVATVTAAPVISVPKEEPAEVRARDAPRSASVVIKVVDKLRDSTVGETSTDGEEEGESSFVSEEDSIKSQPPLPVSVAVAQPVIVKEDPKPPVALVPVVVETEPARAPPKVESSSDEDESELVREEQRTLDRELDAQRKAEEERKQREADQRRREAEKEERRVREKQAEEERLAAEERVRSEQLRKVEVVAVPPVSKKDEKAAIFAEEMRQQELQMAARREKILAEEARLLQQQIRERDEAATEARRKAAIAAQNRRKQQQKQETAAAAKPTVYDVVTVPKSKADSEAPLLYHSKPDTLVENELFDSSDESIYLMWEDGAASRSRALNMSVPTGNEVLYVSEWDPASAAARLLISKKAIPVRVVVSLPPQAAPGTHVLDALPLLVLSNGMHIRGGQHIVDYLIEKYRSSGPVFVNSAPKLRVASNIISNVCDTFLAPLLYLYPSHTITALAGRPAVPMRSADKQKVFDDHLAQLSIIEGYVSRQGPYLTGKGMTACDVLLLPFFVFYTNYCHRLNKVVFDGRPKLRAWYRSMLEDPVVAQIVSGLNDSIVKHVNAA